MRTSYIASGIVLSVLGLVILMGAGGFTFWATGTAGNETETSSATIGVPQILGWAMFLIGVALIIVGAVTDHTHHTHSARGRDLTVVK